MEQQHTYDELQKQKRQYQLLVETTSDVVWTVDAHFQCTYISPSVQNLLGYSPLELLQKSISICLTSDSWDNLKTKYKEWIETENKPKSQLIRLSMVAKNGRILTTETTVALFADKDIDSAGLHGVTRKTSMEKLAENLMPQNDMQLEIKSKELAEVNSALRMMLEQSKERHKQFEQRLLGNVEDLVMPYVKRLQKTDLDRDQQVYTNVIEANLTEIMAPFMRELGDLHANLTPREIEVANMVRMGLTSKQIAGLLDTTKRAVEFHRDSLRKKLGIKKTKMNLRAYLASL